jgi:hypothetical protein
MDAEINNVIYMELYSGAKMVDDKYLKTNNVRSIDRDSTVTVTLRCVNRDYYMLARILYTYTGRISCRLSQIFFTYY